MTKEKQIEEMAELMCDEYDNGICRTDRYECNHNCYYHNKAAQRLYEAGYRKQSEWISVEERLPEDEINEAYDLAFPTTTIKDSGERREFETGAVRDIQEGKGRCDLMPLDVLSLVLGCGEAPKIFEYIGRFQEDGMCVHLCGTLEVFADVRGWEFSDMFLEVAKHFEDGAKKYGEHNWQKGIPVHCYIDSAIRHYLKWLRGDNDEPHDRAFVWNIICCIWTCKHKPELNEYRKEN